MIECYVKGIFIVIILNNLHLHRHFDSTYFFFRKFQQFLPQEAVWKSNIPDHIDSPPAEQFDFFFVSTPFRNNMIAFIFWKGLHNTLIEQCPFSSLQISKAGTGRA